VRARDSPATDAKVKNEWSSNSTSSVQRNVAVTRAGQLYRISIKRYRIEVLTAVVMKRFIPEDRILYV
jgi:hypothetical protein